MSRIGTDPALVETHNLRAMLIDCRQHVGLILRVDHCGSSDQRRSAAAREECAMRGLSIKEPGLGPCTQARLRELQPLTSSAERRNKKSAYSRSTPSSD